jgi:VWFA-related protein
MTDTRRNVMLALVTLLTAVAGLVPAAAQTFSESTDVVVVQVPVNVLINGQPVRGLSVEDFVLLDGRKQQKIIGFEVVDLTQPPVVAPVADRVSAVPLRGEMAVSARRHFLLLFDLSFSQPENLVAAREAAQKLVLEQLHPSDLVAVATYSQMQSYKLLLGFTPDRNQADLAIATLGLPKLFESAGDPLALLLGDLEGRAQPRGGDRPGATADREIAEAMQQFSRQMGRQDRQREQARIASLSRSMSGLARLLASVEGRKQVVFLSEGFDSSALYGTQDAATIDTMSRASEEGRIWEIDSEERFGDSHSQNIMEDMFEQFRRAGATIQTVDIGGLRTEGDVGFGSSRANSASTATRDSRRDGLAVVASSTGGELFRSFNDLSAAMGRLLEHTGVTYLLAFQPENLDLDGSYHRLRVRLKDSPRGTEILHRPGYYAPLPFTQTPEDERRLRTAGLILGSGEGGMLDSSVLAAPIRVSGAKAFVPVLVEIDGRGLLDAVQTATLPIELFVYALDSTGSIHGFLTYEANVDVAQARPALERTGLKFFGHLDLPPGDYELRVLARRRDSGHYSLRGFQLAVPDFSAAVPVLLPAFFAEPFDRWMITRQEGLEERPYPFMAGGQPFLPAALPALAPGSDSAAILLAYGLPGGELEIEGRVLAHRQPSRMAAVSISERAPGTGGGAEAIKLRVDPGELESGEYRLELTVTDPASGQAASSVTPFRVR